MASELARNYDELYRDSAIAFGTGGPYQLVATAASAMSGTKVLELGAGEGRNAVYLARRGCDVTAIDISAIGLRKLRTALGAHGLTAQTQVGDIREIVLTDSFDLVVTTFVLHHLSVADGVAVIRRMQDHTVIGGLNAVAAYGNSGDLAALEGYHDLYYPAPGDIHELYSGWEVIEYDEAEAQPALQKDDGSSMVNSVTRVLARRVNP